MSPKISELLGDLADQGVTVLAREGELRLRGPVAVLDDRLISEVRLHKADLIAQFEEQQALKELRAAPCAQAIQDLRLGVWTAMLSGAVPIVARVDGELVPFPWNRVAICVGCGPVPAIESGHVAECVWCAQREAGYAIPEIVNPKQEGIKK